MTTSAKGSIQEPISKTLCEVLKDDADFAFLMGSAETERFNADSDIDVAVFWKNPTSDDKKNRLWRVLEDKFDQEVDLVSLNKIDVIFGRQVLETGRLLFTSSDGVLLNWKMERMSEYPDFKTSRKVIEDNILNRKKYV